MPKKPLYSFLNGVKLKTVLQSMLLFMGLMFVGIQFYTVYNYSDFINENNASSKSRVITMLVWERLINHHDKKALFFAEKITEDPMFKNSFLSEDSSEIKNQLAKTLEVISTPSDGLDIIAAFVLCIVKR